MGKIVHIHEPYIIKEGRRGYTIYNTKKDFENGHGHIGKLNTCKMLLDLIDNNIVPDSSYLRETCLRICIDTKYIRKVQNKIEKDRDKQQYYNANRGVRR